MLTWMVAIQASVRSVPDYEFICVPMTFCNFLLVTWYVSHIYAEDFVNTKQFVLSNGSYGTVTYVHICVVRTGCAFD